VGVAPFPKAVGDRQEVLFEYRPHQHRYRFLDDFVFDFHKPNRAFLAVVLVDPHALDRRDHVGPPCQPLVQVLQVGLQVLFVILYGDSTQSRCAVPTQLKEGFSKKIEVHAVDQAGEDPIRMCDRLLCDLPKLC